MTGRTAARAGGMRTPAPAGPTTTAFPIRWVIAFGVWLTAVADAIAHGSSPGLLS